MEEKLKYGVNIDLANDTKKHIAKELETDEKRVLNKVGAFSSLFDIRFPEYKNPVLVLKTEEPGSKQLLAMEHDRIESVCFDMINHLINDCIVMGATPLAIQDAIICGKLDSNIIKRCVKAMAQACRAQECVLTGGETSEQPGVINEGTYILTSSIVGIVDQEDIIDGSKNRNWRLCSGRGIERDPHEWIYAGAGYPFQTQRDRERNGWKSELYGCCPRAASLLLQSRKRFISG